VAGGLTRSEQIALVAVAAAVLGGFAVQGWRGRSSGGGLRVKEAAHWEPIPVPLLESSGPPTARPGSEPSPAAIELNTASSVELERLPGIGPVRAQAIVAHREAIGGFTSIEDLLDVYGIGEGTLARIRPYVTLRLDEAAASVPRAPADGAPTESTPSPPTSAAPRSINVNTAGFDELQAIPGIGPALAERILERRRGRPFASPEELIDVRGIGPVNFETMRPWVRVED